MADKTSIDYLPEVFQTPTNKKFLGSTLDQLVQEPKLKQTQGYIGKRLASGPGQLDTYISEFDDNRQNYQFEPGIVFKKNNKKVDALTYPGLLDGLQVQGSKVNNHDRLFSSQTYSWSPLIDFDKFVNYSQYYWLPEGPDAVDVGSDTLFLTNEFDITRNTFTDSYEIRDFVGENPQITLVRKGSYTFNLNQTGAGFFIQSQKGTDGVLPWSSNISSRDVLGVVNNGEDNGSITFNVPTRDAQNFYHNLTDVGPVDIATMLRFDEVNGQLLRDLISLNDIRDLNAKTIVFLNDALGDSTDLGWFWTELYDSEGNDVTPYSDTTFLDTLEERYQIFQIQLIYNDEGLDPYIKLNPKKLVNPNEKFTIQYGAEYSNRTFYKNVGGFFQEQPLLTASLDRLYYQDANNPDMVGVINIIDQEESSTLFMNEIIGKPTYTSPNGVIFTNGLKVKFRGLVKPESFIDNEYYVEGVGNAIVLVSVSSLVTPETYTRTIEEAFDSRGFDTVGYNGSSDAPLDLDYITINRSSLDLNAWSRSNRWFHIDVVLKTAEYNKTQAITDNNFRAKRPIIEFDPSLRLFNTGTIGKEPINVVDFIERDALSNVNGSSGYIVDGYNLVTGTRVVFAADTDANVRNKIYTVEKVDMNSDGQQIINLTLAEDAEAQQNEIILVKNGIKTQGKSFSYDLGQWSESQLKTGVNQPPLFDVYDADGISFSDIGVYHSSTFTGSKLFSYRKGTGQIDPFLGFPLSYLNISNLGDIVFDNNLYADSFLYVDNAKSEEQALEEGFIRKYYSRLLFNKEIGWTTSADFNHVPQIFNFIYTGNPIVIDVLLKKDLLIPVISIYVDNTFLTQDKYKVESFDGVNTVILFKDAINDESLIEVRVISDHVSASGYYQIPENLSSNVFNENSSLFTLGTIRNHYNSLAQNIIGLIGNINGSNNIRDLGKVDKFGNIIMQHSSPMSLVMTFIRSNEYNFFDALKFNSREYEKFKYKILDWVAQNDIYGLTSDEILEKALIDINISKTTSSSFYNTDMLPNGSHFVTVDYEVSAISTDTFNTINVYDFKNANNQALLVYVNNVIQIKDFDYAVADNGPRVTFLKELEIGDRIKFDEYSSTLGSLVPNTPTKLGLFQKFKPEMFVDNTYSTPTNVIRGHDGSISVAFNDVRDEVLLNFELRIYNNIKVNQDIPLSPADITSGQFREADYTDNELTELYSPSLLDWLGWNRIDYKIQDYRADNEWTWNYSNSGNKLDDKLLKGHWRGIYKFYYDTDSPHLRPWEMLGLSEQPDWWVLRYGPPPYTSGNKNLWDDLEIGLIKYLDGDVIAEQFIRPNLSSVIPVDSAGNLISPMNNMISNYSKYDFRASWKIGDDAPAETAFRRSSAWPFTFQRLLATTKPAQYFALMADRDRYQFDVAANQYLYDNRLRLDSRQLEIVSNTTPKHSYVNWIADYNIHHGYRSVQDLSMLMADTDINLCYRMASFTDKNNMKLFTDKSSPDSTTGSLLIPDESFELLLYRNQPFDEIVYSAATIQKVQDGFAVFGNSKDDPYFKIMQSIPNGNFKEFLVGRTAKDATTIRIPLDFTNNIVFIPYGFVFKNIHQVVDFLVSNGKYLSSQGLEFNAIENTVPVNWIEMAKEFVYWRDQGWEEGSIISLNPGANIVEFERDLTVVDSLLNLAVNNQPQDQNKIQLSSKDYAIDRINNTFTMTPLNETIIGFLNFQLTQFEHLLILDNLSIFNDLMYDPVLGIRQRRIKIHGVVSADWTGKIESPGFILNDDNIVEWNKTVTYNKGNIVKFKNDYWNANETVQSREIFEFNKWTKIDYNIITTGMLSNPATKSDAMLRYYDNHTANLESDADLLSLGLTGFRPRQYLSGLDLDDISQVNIYRNMIENKGTPDSLDLFKDVRFNNETTDYEIFENWAVKRAVYGASSSRAFVEFNINEVSHTSNPTSIEIVQDVTVISTADQVVPIDDIFKQSIRHINPTIFPLLEEKITDVSLPYAGFVDRNDINIATFSLDNFIDIDIKNAEIIEGWLIWVAKDTKYDWNVYRVSPIVPEIIKVLDNLNGTLTFEFDGSHNLDKNDVIIIKYFDPQINRTFNVTEITHPRRLIVVGSLLGDQTQIKDVGVGFVLTDARIDMPSAIVDSLYDHNLFMDDTVWVKEDNGLARVYNKSVPFTASAELTKVDVTYPNTNYGVSNGQSLDAKLAIVGEPNTEFGVLHLYVRTGTSQYLFRTTIDLNNVDGVRNLGNAIAMGNEYHVIGAEGEGGHALILRYDTNSNSFVNTQLLTIPNANGYGTDVAISDNENWVYVSEMQNNRVHAYQKIKYQHQKVAYTGDGITRDFSFKNVIVIGVNDATQLLVIKNNTIEIPNLDYIVSNETVIFSTPPRLNDDISIVRKSTSNRTITSPSFEVNEVTDLFMFNNDESVTIYVNQTIQRLNVDYSVDISSHSIRFLLNQLAEEDIVIITTDTYYKFVNTITSTDSNPGDKFGFKIDTSVDGADLVVSAPSTTVDNLDKVGKVYIFNREVQRTVVKDKDITEYRAIGVQLYPNAQHLVYVNGKELITELTNTPEYVTQTNLIVLNYPEIKVGDFLDIATNEFRLVQIETINNVNENANYGSAVSMCKSKSSIYIGADCDNTVNIKGGSVERLINSARIYGSLTGRNQKATLNNSTIRINGVSVNINAGWGAKAVAEQINHIDTVIPNVVASESNEYLTIELIDKELSSLASKLDVQPGLGSAFYDLGLEPFEYAQTITSPNPTNYARFGSDVVIDKNTNQIIISAVNGSTYKLVQFDNRTTTFDGRTMRIVDEFTRSGAVYSYDLLRDETRFSPGAFAFGQEIYDSKSILTSLHVFKADTTKITTDNIKFTADYTDPELRIEIGVNNFSKFGQSLSLSNGVLLVGSPGYDYPIENIGRVAIFYNAKRELSWNILRSEQEQIDVRLINSIKLYNKQTENTIRYLDYIDPLNGKILGVAKENLDFITTIDPATYTSSQIGIYWGERQLGKMWWDITDVRFLDYHQADINYSNTLWGKVFPGSSIDVYQWIESVVPPLQYTGEGVPKNFTDFVSISEISSSNTIINKYYFWVKDIRTISSNMNKKLSAYAVASYIESPQSSGIPYATFIKQNAIGLVNSNNLMSEFTTILHIEYDNILNDNNIFLEYDLIRENNKDDFLADGLYKKFLDSFCGVDTLGNLVPAVNLSTGEKYGISFRPRQSMFRDRFAALKSYIVKVNDLLANFTMAEGAVYPLLESDEPFPPPGSGAWDISVSDLQELSYQDLALVDPGYNILVENDASNNNLWTIYKVSNSKDLILIRVQHYDTNQYWDLIDWYAPTISVFTKIDNIVNTYSDLLQLPTTENKVVKVRSNSINNWELYKFKSESNNWVRVGLQDGTIEFNASLYDYSIGRFGFDTEVFDAQYFDQEPVIETRNIIRSINEEILIGNFAAERNKMLISVFNYVISEQQSADWLYKTSLLDVNHRVRSLLPYSVYKKDNQDYVYNYIEETKPYHCKIKDFLLSYDGMDVWDGTVTDFDCPSQWSDDFQQFISPVLDEGAILKSDPSNAKASDPIWRTQPWDQWFQNNSLSFSSVFITNVGGGYTVPPQVTVIGTAKVEAQLLARINGGGQVKEIVVINPGEGYTATPEIIIDGGNGFGATASAVTKNSLIRSVELTMKYDRYEYKSSITQWLPEQNLQVDDRVRYKDKAFAVVVANDDLTFVANKYRLLDINELSGVDRTMGYYVPGVNQPGLDLALLINGIAYPGVDVHGLDFSANDGWDGAKGFDMEPFDNAIIGANGYVTYSETLIDTNYSSEATDEYLGTRPTDINVVGGAFVDTYHSHSPEELIPGATFDTLDFKVFGRPGWDFAGNGHIFELDSVVYSVEGEDIFEFPTADMTTYTADDTLLISDAIDLGTVYHFSFADVSNMPVTVMVFNVTQGITLYENIHYTSDWKNKVVDIYDGIDVGEFVKITVTGIGGGEQLFRRAVPGSDVVDDRYLIPVKKSDIKEAIVFENGIRLINVNIIPIDNYTSEILFSDTFEPNDIITITILGFNSEFEENLYQVTTFDVGGSNDALFSRAFFNVDKFVDPNDTITQFFMPDGTVNSTLSQMNAVVELNGLRLRSPEGIRYIAEADETKFNFPVTGDLPQDNNGLYQGGVQDFEVIVFKNNQQLTLNIDYNVSPAGGIPSDTARFNTLSPTADNSIITVDDNMLIDAVEYFPPIALFNVAVFVDGIDIPRYITLFQGATENDKIEVYITTLDEYKFVYNSTIEEQELILDTIPTAGDLIGVVSYGDPREMDILTEVFVGPSIASESQTDAFDQSNYDMVGFDQDEGVNINVNIFELTQTAIIVSDRLWVTVNGIRLDSGSGYEISGNILRIHGNVLASTDVLNVTSTTNNTVHDGISFRYFKDMRDNRAMYSMMPDVETQLTQHLAIADDTIHVKDASRLSPPSLSRGVFGVLIVDGERITYRERNVIDDTVSGLRRGTAGTAITEHLVNTSVYSIGLNALVPGSAVPGGNTSFLLQDIEIDSNGVVWSISEDGLFAEADTMYLNDVRTLSLLSWEKTGVGVILLDNYEIRFESKDADNNSVSEITVKLITNDNRVDSTLITVDSTLITVDLSDSNSNNYSKGTPVNNMVLDMSFYRSEELVELNGEDLNINKFNGLNLQDQNTIQGNFLNKWRHKIR